MQEIQAIDKKYRYRLVQIYVCIMFSIYPLIYHNFYYDIVTCKYVFFISVTGIFLVLILVMMLFSMPNNYFNDFKLRNIHLSNSDYFVLGFLTVNIISVILSDNKVYAITGADGRNMGLMTVVAMCILYFVISGNYVENTTFYYVLCMGSIAVSVLGIMNFLNIDILGFYKGLNHAQKLNYISTLGHIDVYTSYFALSIPMVYIIYLTTHSMRLKILSFMALVINICGLAAGQCDSGYIIMFTSCVLAIVLIRGKQRGSVYLLPIVVSTVIIRIMIFFNDRHTDKRELSRFAKYVYGNNACMIIMCMFAICVIIECHKTIDMSDIWKIVLKTAITGILVYVMALCIFSTIFKDVKLGSMEGVLRFSDSFGSYRGYIWKLLIKDYSQANIKEKYFGIGTDTMRPYLMKKYGDSVYAVTNAYYDNAHNELIQYLITTGISGLVMYIGILVSSIKKGIKTHRIIFLSAVICYVIQSFVNINQVVTTPLFFIMLACINTKDNIRVVA